MSRLKQIYVDHRIGAKTYPEFTEVDRDIRHLLRMLDALAMLGKECPAGACVLEEKTTASCRDCKIRWADKIAANGPECGDRASYEPRRW